MPLPLGKLPSEFLQKNLDYLKEISNDKSVIIGPLIGQDNAIIDIGDRYLVVKSDPVTFVTDQIGYYAVSINANDIVLSGAKPQWFLCTVLLPKNITKEEVSQIFRDIAKECQKWDITVCGGHTEVTSEISRPIVNGTMLGLVDKNRLITTLGGKPGDALLLTHGIAIEGAAIICHEKQEELEKHLDSDLIDIGKNRLKDPGICIVKEAQLLASNFDIHAMHDPTEGGLAMGIVELAKNSNCGVILDLDAIPLISPTQEICEIFQLNPMGLISSGCVLCAVDPQDVPSIQELMVQNHIPIYKIGNLTEIPEKYEIQQKNGEIRPLHYSEKDELTKIW